VNGKINQRQLLADAFFLGFITLGAQIILLREFLLIYSNNELVVGVLLALWMILTAAGTFSFRFFRLPGKKSLLLRLLFLFLAFYPPVAAFIIESYRNHVVEAGRMFSLAEVLLTSTIILLPFCFTGGFLFVLINSLSKKDVPLRKIYSYESLGSLTAGALVSFYFIYAGEFNNFQSLEYLLLILLTFLTILDFRKMNYPAAAVFFGVFLLSVYVFEHSDLNLTAKKRLFKGQEIVETKETFLGNVTVTKTGDQLNFFENDMLLFSTGNIVQREEDVHYAMLQRYRAEKVLIAGGGITGTSNEVLKYPSVAKVDYVEHNPYLLALGKKYTRALDNKVIGAVALDPAVFISRSREKYDVILVDQPAPVNASANRFYTVEFYKRAKKVLAASGVLSTRLPYSENYAGTGELEVQASVYNSLKKNFRNVLVVPGQRLYFIASDSTLEFNYLEALKKTGIDNDYVNASYVNDMLLKFKSYQMVKDYQTITLLNQDFKPVVYFSYLQHWLSFFNLNIRFFVIPVVIIVLLFLLLSKGLAPAVFTSGFTSAASEVTLLIVFQVISGDLYLMMGVLFTLFMAGLAAGSWLVRFSHGTPEKVSVHVQVLSAVIMVAAGAFLMIYEKHQMIVLAKFFIFAVTFLMAVLTGYQYGISVSGGVRKVSGIYSSDLAGAATGSFLPAVFLVPQTGICNTLYLLALLHVITFVVLKMKKLPR
jgi:predicted membrane-bound spermidine synthase